MQKAVIGNCIFVFIYKHFHSPWHCCPPWPSHLCLRVVVICHGASASANVVVHPPSWYDISSRKDVDETDLDRVNLDTFIFINNLHWDMIFLPEKKWEKRILTVWTWTPSSSLTISLPRTSIGIWYSFQKRSERKWFWQQEPGCLHLH